MTGRGPTVLAAAALVVVIVAATLIVTGTGSGSYAIHARFADASQRVRGNVVLVAGRRVGEVTGMELTPDGLARVDLKLDDDSVKPLHRGTRVTVRTLGLSGVANRYVDLTPGPPTAAKIPEGGTIDTQDTRGVVDLDVLLDAIDPQVRRDIRGIVRDAATALTPAAAKQTNRGLHYLSPAVSRLTALGSELTRDDAALKSLLRRTASLGTVLAEHRDTLGSGIEATAGTLEAVASERGALGDALEVMGLDAVAYRGSTRLLGCWLVLPVVDGIAIMVGITASYIAVVIQIGQVSAGGYLQLFWMFQSPTDFVFSLVKGMAMATFVILVGIYFGYHAADGPVGVGRATARSMGVNIVGIHIIGLLTTQIFWGQNPRAPIGG
jgi:ABC-type transporter Mla maintaining outer membrane lipid asymmetry permease subunit MlaE